MTTIRDYVNHALDSAYKRDAGGMLQQVKNYSTSSAVKAQTDKLIEEAERLEEEGNRFDATNAELAQTLGTAADVFNFAERSVSANDNIIQASALDIATAAILAQIIANLSPNAINGNPLSPAAQKRYTGILEASGIDWRQVDTGVLETLTGYVETDEYKQWIGQWGDDLAQHTSEIIYSNVAKGNSPISVAYRLRDIINQAPQYVVERFTRTLQLTSYRDAEMANAVANQTYIKTKVRTAVKDLRTCLSCLALDGTVMRVDERIDDHYHGRCFAVYLLPGQEYTGQTGAEWFASLPEERQRQQVSFAKSPAKFEAYKNGTPLSDFVGTRDDKLFGRQTYELSLKKAIGLDNASKFYTRKPQVNIIQSIKTAEIPNVISNKLDLSGVGSYEEVYESFNNSINNGNYNILMGGNRFSGLSKVSYGNTELYFDEESSKGAADLAMNMEFFKRNNGEELYSKMFGGIEQVIVSGEESIMEGGGQAIADAWRNGIRVFNKGVGFDYETLIHEAAHNATGSSIEMVRQFEALIQNGDLSPTIYGKTNVNEDIAESFTLFFMEPDRLSRKSESRYEIIRKFLNE